MQIDIIGIAISSLIGGWVVLVNLFAAVMHCKAILDRGEKLPKVFLYPLAVGAAVGVMLDVLANFVIGTIAFREAPRELTMTERCKRHKAGHGWQKRRAEWWCEQLGKFDPGHC